MKVFVGSTYQDLLTYREAATRAILKAGDLSEDMLYWPAVDAPPLDESLLHLRSSNLMILLIAHKYGTAPSGRPQSITELEFDEAMRIRLPVLAFQVDPDQLWSPRFMESDREAQSRLAQFIDKVRRNVVVGSFTTPDSLEVAITHAVMHHVGRRMSVAIPEYARKRLRDVNRAELLMFSPDATVRVGNAPDGAPLLLSVTRRIEVSDPMARIAESVGGRVDDEIFSKMISDVSQAATTHAARSGVYSASLNGNIVRIYAPYKTIVDLMSPNLFQSMLGVKSKVSANGTNFHSESTIRSGLDPSQVRHEDVVSLGGGNRYLAIGLDDEESAWTGGWSSSQPSRFFLSRPFIEEGLERLAGVRYVIKRKKDSYGYVAARGDELSTVVNTEVPHKFHERWVDLLTSADDDELNRHLYEIHIPRMSIVRFVLEVVEEAGDLHSRELIHGDIKSSNILVNRSGNTLIDDVALTVGEISPTVTVGWSPFEQLLRQPLTCAADVYALGQLLLHVIGGQLLGKEVTYLMPAGKKGVVIEDPAVYLDANGCIGSAVDRKNWSRFIERALKTDPGQRWSNAKVMAAELRTLIDRDGIEGQVSIELPWGNRPTLTRKANGEIGVGWVMHHGEITRVW